MNKMITALLVGVVGCATATYTTEPEVTALGDDTTDATQYGVWAHDQQLEALTRDAEGRLNQATGLQIDVNRPGRVGRSTPVFWSITLPSRGLTQTGPAGASWIAIAQGGDASDVLRQLVHGMGVPNLEPGVAGVMQLGGGGAVLTEADLELICAHKVCSKFVPE